MTRRASGTVRGTRRRAAVAMAVAAVLCAAPAAPALAAPGGGPISGAHQRLDKGTALFRDLDYRRAISVLEPIARDPGATRADKLRALELIGQSHLILGEKKQARAAFAELLAIDPGYQLHDGTGSPKIRNFFEQVRAAVVPGYQPGEAVKIAPSAPTGATAGSLMKIDATVTAGTGKVVEMAVRWRRRGGHAYGNAPMRRVGDRHWRAEFSLPAGRAGYTLEYYIEARDLGGRAIGRAGSPEHPLALPVAPGRAVVAGTPWYRRWYVIAGGALVLGLGGGALVLTTSGASAPQGTLDPGKITLTP